MTERRSFYTLTLTTHSIPFHPSQLECSALLSPLCPPQYMLYSCPLSMVSFCAVLPSSPKVFGFVAKHPAADMYHCYLFQSKAFVSCSYFTSNLQIPKGTSVIVSHIIIILWEYYTIGNKNAIKYSEIPFNSLLSTADIF